MPPTFAARCWSSLCGKWPELTRLDADTAALIIEGSADAYLNTSRQTHPGLVRDRNGVPPNPEEVKAYVRELNSGISPDEFMDFYTARGWIISGSTSRMKDWKAAVRLWTRRQAAIGPGPNSYLKSGPASLFALQAQLKTIETEMEGILFPGGSQWKVTPTGAQAVRFDKLHAQRRVILDKIEAFARS